MFCIEAYRHAEGISGAVAVDRFAAHGVIDYLRDVYDVLHTLGESALVEDIRDFIHCRSVKA